MDRLIRLCPVCGGLGVPVETKTVRAFAGRPEAVDGAWQACASPACTVGYYSENGVLHAAELPRPLWWKDGSAAVPVCYCSGLTRGEIAAAVRAGCTTPAAVREMTGRTETGRCLGANPLGRCCHEVLLREIAMAAKDTG